MADPVPRLVALLGDSILDNARYAAPEPDTASHLQSLLGPGWAVALAAQDGATMDLLPLQLQELSGRPDVTILSLGGNDAAGNLDILQPRHTTSTEILTLLENIADDFEEQYAEVLAQLRPLTQRLIVCTIYEPPLENSEQARLALVPLGILNDRIIRCATRAGVDVLDLRSICTEPGDFVQEIEPSATGARKVAEAIAAVIGDPRAGPGGRVYQVRIS
jgi:lysophospholipase L1-like esterase